MRTLLPTLAAAMVLLAPSVQANKFYADDPVLEAPKPRDASKAVRRKISDYYDFFQQTFAPTGEINGRAGAAPKPAQAVNTLGEPFDRAWWTPRHYYRRMSVEELQRGPGNSSAPSTDGVWTVVKAKSEGVTPGFEFIDSRKRRYVLKFDPLEYPEIATGPDVLVSKFFYALGYHVPENYIVTFTRDQLKLGEDVELVDARGKARKMTERDVTELLLRVPRDRDGRYRGGASLFLRGKPLGPYKYQGLRRDDPNDIVRHEHRRDLRGLSVFCAWLAHDDSRAINSLDMLIDEGGTPHIRHYLIDFGSTLGSASYGPNSPRSGFEYVFSWKPAIRQFFTFGFLVPEWAKARYPRDPAVGLFESAKFDAAGWLAEYPNPAFTNRLADDAFWGAKQVMAFRDEEIRAIVATGNYSQPETADWISKSLIERRDKIGRAFFAAVLPLDRFEVRDRVLTFDDLEVVHKLRGRRQYRFRWSEFNNARETKTPIPEASGAQVPADRVQDGGYLVCEIQGEEERKTMSVYLRRRGASWEVVGVDRTW